MYKPNIKHEEKDIVSQRNKTLKAAKLFRKIKQRLIRLFFVSKGLF